LVYLAKPDGGGKW